MKKKNKKISWIFLWGFISLIFLIVIHIVFHMDGPSWLEAEWTAGEILTYVSTVSLGLLAFWQNMKLKEENDKAQKRLERINIQSNEINFISMIADYEIQRYNRSRDFLEGFIKEFEFDSVFNRIILLKDKNNEDFGSKIILNIREEEERLNSAFFNNPFFISENKTEDSDYTNLERCLNTYFRQLKKVFKIIGTNTYKSMENQKKFLEETLEEVLFDTFSAEGDTLKKEFLNLVTVKKRYLANEQKKIDTMLYGGLSLEEVRALYSKQDKADEKQNQ